MYTSVENLISQITPSDKAAAQLAKNYQARLAKPPQSLGRLEELSIQLAAIFGKVHNKLSKKCLIVFAADNGVVCEGVSSAPQSVTLKQAINLTKGITGASALAKHFGCCVKVCDVGINADITCPEIINRKIAYGTENIANGPAMSKEQAITAILTGADIAMNSDADVLGIGEMGIGNTTTASAVLAVLTNSDPDLVTGKGGGLTNEALLKKKAVVKRAIEINNPNGNDVIDVISKVGGFDIAAMCGAFLGAAAAKKPVVTDGFISAVSALCATRLCPLVRDYIIPSHKSCEPGYFIAAKEMGIKPFLDLDMRLGEGSGCVIAFQILDAACAAVNNMATFENADINDDYLDEIRRFDNL